MYIAPLACDCDMEFFSIVYLGSRRLLTYRRLPDSDIKGDLVLRQRGATKGSTANDLNAFRKRVSDITFRAIVPC